MDFLVELEGDSVGSLPLKNAIIIKPNTLVRAAVAMMRDQSLGCAVIIDRLGEPCGIFTERSLIRVLMQDASLDGTPVCDFAERDFLCVGQDDPILGVWEAIRLAKARFVCVTGEDGKILGISGQRGLAEYVSDCFAQQTTVQRLGSTPWIQEREGA